MASARPGELSTSASPFGLSRILSRFLASTTAFQHSHIRRYRQSEDSKPALYYQRAARPLKFREDCVNSSLLNAVGFQLSPYAGIAAPCISFASGLHRKRMTWAISSGFGHL